jgi:phosphoribosylformylglycinamidine cyclo-ligase
MAELNYKKAGVDRDKADRLVGKIQTLTRSTLNSKVISSVGGYASLYQLDSERCIAASTDGVGTKLKVAMELGVHRTVGIDLVAMSVNDLLCTGARPLFFLDYFATGKLKNDVASQVIEGIVEGCLQAQCALVGGETAEMPDFYQPGEYDLAGFAVGEVKKNQILPNRKIRPGLVLIGVASSGAHSNGYSLLRRLVPKSGVQRKKKLKELLTPTRIYVQSVLPLLEQGLVEGLAHITGSGFLNVPRISTDVSYSIDLPPADERAPIFEWIRTASKLPLAERAQTFNCGIGLVLAVQEKNVEPVLRNLWKKGEKAWCVGRTEKKAKGRCEVKVREGYESCELFYE